MSRPPRVLGELGLVEQALLLVQERPEKGFAQFRDDRKAVSKLRIFFYLRLREFLEWATFRDLREVFWDLKPLVRTFLGDIRTSRHLTDWGRPLM